MTDLLVRPPRISEYPLPIAAHYALLDEDSEPNAYLRQIIRTFSFTLKFVSLVGLSEYLARVARSPEIGAGEIDGFLAEHKLERPSLGHFAELLRVVLKDSASWLDDSSVAGLSSIMDTQRKLAKRTNQHVDNLVHVRNLFGHSDEELRSSELELLVASRRDLDLLLSELDWLADGQLVMGRPDGSLFACAEEIRPLQAPASTFSDVLVSGLSPREETLVLWSWGGHHVALPPFLIECVVADHDNEARRVAQFETLRGKKIKYLYGTHHEFTEDPWTSGSLYKLAAEARGRRQGEDTDPEGKCERLADAASWAAIRARARAQSEATTGRQNARRKYLRTRYVSRKKTEESLSVFLRSEKRLLVLVGGSGVGKTNLLCWLSDQASEMPDGDAVLHYYAREHGATSLADLLAADLGCASRAELWGSLAAMGELAEVRDGGRRLVVLLDAVNEHPDPVGLFRRCLDFVEDERLPAWVKLIVSCRPLPWEHIRRSVILRRDLVFWPGDEQGTAEPQLTLGKFTADELRAAWQAWRDQELAEQGVELPHDIDESTFPLLQEPVLFRCFAETESARAVSGLSSPHPLTREEILLRRFLHLRRGGRRRVKQVAEAMWKLRSDYLTTDDYTGIEELQRWLTSDAGPDTMVVYSCPEHPGKNAVDERTLRAGKHPARFLKDGMPMCSQCRKPLQAASVPLLPPLESLVDEGFLSLYQRLGKTNDEVVDEVLRFTYDRMYEAVTADTIIVERLRSRFDPDKEPDEAARQLTKRVDELARIVGECSSADRSAVMSAVHCAMMTLLGDSSMGELLRDSSDEDDAARASTSARPSGSDRQLAKALLEGLGDRSSSLQVRDFLVEVLVQWWAREDETAMAFARAGMEKGIARLTSGEDAQSLGCGLAASTMALCLLLPPLEGGSDVCDRARASRADRQALAVLEHLVDLAYHSDPNGSVERAERGDVGGREASLQAFGGVSPSDFCLRQLLLLCQRFCRSGATSSAVLVVALLLARLDGVRGIVRSRNRLAQLTNWVSQLLTTETGNFELATGVVREIRHVLERLPLLGPRSNAMTRRLRTALLRAAAVPTFAIINSRVRTQLEKIPKRELASPDDPTPDLYLLMHLREPDAEMFERFIELYDASIPLSDGDIELLKSVSTRRFTEPFAGIFAAVQGGIFALRSMRDLQEAVPMIERLVADLEEGEEISYYLINLVWGLLFHQKPLSEGHAERLMSILLALVGEPSRDVAPDDGRRQLTVRERMLERYEVSGQLKFVFCSVPLNDRFGGEGMTGTKALVSELVLREDWTALARVWDQLTLFGLRYPVEALNHVKEVLDLRKEGVEILVGHGTRKVPVELLLESSGDMVAQNGDGAGGGEGRHLTYLDPDRRLTDADATPALAVLHLLSTIGNIELENPLEVDSFFRTCNVPESLQTLCRRLRRRTTVEQYNDQSLAGYFAMYAIFEYPKVGSLLREIWKLTLAGAKRRGFKKPRRRDFVATLVPVLDRALDALYGKPAIASHPRPPGAGS